MAKKDKILEILGNHFADDPVAMQGVHTTLSKHYEKMVSRLSEELRQEHREQIKEIRSQFEDKLEKISIDLLAKHTAAIAKVHEVDENVRKKSDESGKASQGLEQKVNDVLNLHKNLEKKMGKKFERYDKYGTRIEKISEFAVGAPNRSLYVNGVLPSPYYSDVNFLAGTGITITPATNEQTQQATITIANTSSGFTTLIPTSGVVNGSNKVFVFSQAPSLIVADGVTLPAVGNNGDVFWTIAGTTVTMTNPPAYSLFGIA